MKVACECEIRRNIDRQVHVYAGSVVLCLCVCGGVGMEIDVYWSKVFWRDNQFPPLKNNLTLLNLQVFILNFCKYFQLLG